jgi:hypothetical protein
LRISVNVVLCVPIPLFFELRNIVVNDLPVFGDVYFVYLFRSGAV